MKQTKVPAIDPEEEIDFMNIDEMDFGSLSRPEQIRHLEVEGYIVLPEILDADRITRWTPRWDTQVTA